MQIHDDCAFPLLINGTSLVLMFLVQMHTLSATNVSLVP